MKGKFYHSPLLLTTLKLIIFVLVLALGIFSYQQASKQFVDLKEDNAGSLFLKSTEILNSITRLDSALQLCEKSGYTCNNSETQLYTSDLDNKIIAFQNIAANEKDLVSTAGMVNFDIIRLQIRRYNETKNITELQDMLNDSLEKSVEVTNSIILLHNLKQKKELNKSTTIILSLFIPALLLSLLYFILSNLFVRKLEVDKNSISALFNHVLDNIKDLNHTIIKEKLSDITTSKSEKKIYSMLLFSFEKLENEKLKTDLFQRLYSLLGYEIRGITNTIQGGVNLLVQDKDESQLLLATDVITATRTLENLAENFNQLSSTDMSNNSNTVNLIDISSDLIVLLATKSKNLNKSVECYVNSNLPLTFYGHQTGLFWLLLMQISEALSSTDYKKVLLTLNCSASHRVDHLMINFDLYLYDAEIASIEEMQASPWDKTSQKMVTNKALTRTLASKVKNYQVTLQKIDSISKFSTSFHIQPELYQTKNSLLIGKKILLCGGSAMQVSVLHKMLLEQGAEVIVAATPNDIFKSIGLLDNNDGILLTNKIKGVKINTFCKIAKARIGKKNIKLFLSISTSEETAEEYLNVDNIFYHPCPPDYFVSSMLEHLEKDAQEEEVVNNKVLIVEDDKLQQFILKKFLTDLGYESDVMGDGKEVLDSLSDLDYQFIFMDCIMPNIGGIEATERIRAYEKEYNLPRRIIIGATALTSEEEHKACIDAGMDHIIHKPYKKENIFSAIKKYDAMRKVTK